MWKKQADFENLKITRILGVHVTRTLLCGLKCWVLGLNFQPLLTVAFVNRSLSLVMVLAAAKENRK